MSKWDNFGIHRLVLQSLEELGMEYLKSGRKSIWALSARGAARVERERYVYMCEYMCVRACVYV
jgi:hypothetical protein